MSEEGRKGRRYRAVVVDDEPAARAAVTTFLSEVDEVEVVAEADDGGEAIELISTHRPDLLFLDIQMPSQDGFAVLEALGPEVPRGVVLVTAHGKYAQRAFDVHAVDYVTKPFGRPRFMAAVTRALHRLEADEALDMRTTLRSLVGSLAPDADRFASLITTVERGGSDFTAVPARLGVRLGSRTHLVEIDDIDWIEADGDFVRLHVGEQTHLLQTPMRELETLLAPARFFRIHRSIIVRLDRIDVLHRDPDGGGSVRIATGVSLRVARARWEALEEALGLRTSADDRGRRES